MRFYKSIAKNSICILFHVLKRFIPNRFFDRTMSLFFAIHL